MIYGDLRLRDRLLRGAIGAVLGGSAGLIVMLRAFMRAPYAHATLLIPAAAFGAAVSGFLAFRRKKIGW